MSTWAQQIAGARVTLEHLAEASRIAALAPADDALTYIAIQMKGIFPDEHLVAAILMRMNLLSAVIARGGVAAWVKADDDDYLVSEALYSAAAAAPLLRPSGELGFDIEELRQLALQFSEAEGRA